MLTVNGETKYEFDDLVARNGYAIARATFNEIVTTTDVWINAETGETGTLDPPERLDETCLFDEVGWQDLCDYADELAASGGSWSRPRVGDEIWRLHQGARGRRRNG